VTVAHVADLYHRYPGEVVTLHTCVDLRESLSDLTLRISIPAGLEMGEYRAPHEKAGVSLYVEVDDRGQYLVWPLEGTLPAGARYEYQVEARLPPMEENRILESQATLTDNQDTILDEESVTIAVWAKGRYLRYLPELYEQDDLMGRLLMFFESFWAPIERQIDAIDGYVDPRTTPTSFLPWLAGWLGLEFDERLSAEQHRRLIRSAISLHRRRGTKRALQEYLEIYTEGEVQILEHRATDFRLGPEARLGLGVALGTGHQPHTFSVFLCPPHKALSRLGGDSSRQELVFRRAIESVIDAQKPAHTSYTLRLEPAHEEEEG
jgi:phage tail-like protein